MRHFPHLSKIYLRFSIQVEEMQSKELYPYMHSVESVVRRGASIPLQLYEKDQLAQALQSARNWKRGAADMFLKKVSYTQTHVSRLSLVSKY